MACAARKTASGRIAAVGHRIVHGGTDFVAPVRIDAAVLEALATLVPLAPLHQPHNLAGVRAAMKAFDGVPQVACFDTAFHRTVQPEVNRRFALPRALHDAGVRRYGFHGLSYESIARSLPDMAPELAHKRVIVAHLGNGASMCAHARKAARWPARWAFRRSTADDGHALRPHRCGRGAVPDALARHVGRRRSRRCCSANRACSGCRACRATCARSKRPPSPPRPRPSEHFTEQVVQHMGSLARRCAVSMPSCSPAASARTPRRCASASSKTANGSA
jgi:acetate kinase